MFWPGNKPLNMILALKCPLRTCSNEIPDIWLIVIYLLFFHTSSPDQLVYMRNLMPMVDFPTKAWTPRYNEVYMVYISIILYDDELSINSDFLGGIIRKSINQSRTILFWVPNQSHYNKGYPNDMEWLK